MTDLARVGLSLERRLLEQFDALMARKGYANRSEAVRDLIRASLVSEDAEADQSVVGTLTIVYDHHQSGLAGRIIETQHQAQAKVLALTHVHLDHDYCLEVIIVRGRTSQLQALADHLLSLRGVKSGRLVVAASVGDRTDSDLAGAP